MNSRFLIALAAFFVILGIRPHTVDAAEPLKPETVTANPARLPDRLFSPLAVDPPVLDKFLYLPFVIGGRDPVEFIGAGDIAYCTPAANDTAKLLDAYPNAVVFTAGDNVQNNPVLSTYEVCYTPTWGRALARTHPTMGNHDVPDNQVDWPGDYFNYFGTSAGEPGKGYYSYNLGSWHIVALNSNCTYVNGCGAGKQQETWLRADLAANPNMCTMAIMHHPRFSGDPMLVNNSVLPLYQAMYDAGVDVVLSGHYHRYDRLAPLDPSGTVDTAKGIRQFIVGTGGADLIPGNIANDPTIEFEKAGVYGIIRFELAATSYRWNFISAADGKSLDSGTADCHK